MKSSVIVASLLAALAVAKPLEKRFILTEVEWATCIVTVTAGDHAGGSPPPGPTPDNNPPPPPPPQPAAQTTTPAPPPPPQPEYAPPTSSPSPPQEGPNGGKGSSPAYSPAAVSPAPASYSSTAPSSGNIGSYAQSVLDQHNNHRANHSVPALVWSDEMTSIAAQIAASCVYAHNTGVGGGGYGQNIGAGAAPDGVPAMITNEMYDREIVFYPTPYGQNSPDMSNFENWGHFSQIVWASTTSVGCATQYCPNGLANTGGGVQPYFTVCNYSPPGNFAGQYGSNVLPPQGEASVSLKE